jgi:hypothetical protein
MKDIIKAAREYCEEKTEPAFGCKDEPDRFGYIKTADDLLKHLESLQALTPTDKDVEADGYVAWHPEKGIRHIALSKSSCWERLLGISQADYDQFELYITDKEHEMRNAEANGWQIRPVKLVFTDKPKSEGVE